MSFDKWIPILIVLIGLPGSWYVARTGMRNQRQTSADLGDQQLNRRYDQLQEDYNAARTALVTANTARVAAEDRADRIREQWLTDTDRLRAERDGWADHAEALNRWIAEGSPPPPPVRPTFQGAAR